MPLSYRITIDKNYQLVLHPLRIKVQVHIKRKHFSTPSLPVKKRTKCFPSSTHLKNKAQKKRRRDKREGALRETMGGIIILSSKLLHFNGIIIIYVIRNIPFFVLLFPPCFCFGYENDIWSESVQNAIKNLCGFFFPRWRQQEFF